jgi:hypothetical protein
MKSMTTKLMITAAALAIATGVASAQAYHADIPFAFRAGNQVMAPGHYTISVEDRRAYVTVANPEQKSKWFLSTSAGTRSAADAPPILAFECQAGRCRLASLSTGSGSDSLNFARPRSARNEVAAATEIRLVHLGD